MPSCSNVKPNKSGHLGHQNKAGLSECHESPSKPEEEDNQDEDGDEEEDVDFNPFLKETLSPEASSSLSSEVEGLDGDVVESSIAGINSSKHASKRRNCDGESEHGEEEVVMQTSVFNEGLYEKDSQEIVVRNPKENASSLVSKPGSEAVREKENNSGSGTDVNGVVEGELVNTTDSRRLAIDLDTEDAICTRTRARYSLASFTLDELETFLQETDDEDDLQNADDEEEYRKFLASVLHGGDGDGHLTQENDIADDDEDNDADFELELEEALESDNDENTTDISKREYEKGRRPETRQNRRQKAYAQCKKKLATQTKRPLRPLLPVLPNVPISHFSTQDRMMPEAAPSSLFSPIQDGHTNGFTQQQIGQLHCLINEHVQLLIQVFCLCAVDSSRQYIASEVQKLILEMLNKRNEVLTWKTVPYPSTCFFPHFLCPSVSDNVPKFSQGPHTLESSTNTADEVCSLNNEASTSQNIHLSKGRSERARTGQADSLQNMEGFFWVPHISGPMVTILDVAPLSLAGKFVNDVEKAVQVIRQRQVESSCEDRFEKEPLFPLPAYHLVAQANSEVLSRTSLPANSGMPSSLSQQPPKKTLATTLVESTKKQSVALVPRDIKNLAQIFFPLFNPALFPHKPPSASVSNRVLFTESEDALLALGMLEYNTDWKAIQQRFLPCKSKHQIFVRQKNRCSSKAPENSIKAVRRMKTSALTAEEIGCIQEALKVYKYDWISIWRFIVPHRDPSLLPRQWRVARGIQKSYKLDEERKEKRRLYETNRRRCKSAGLANWPNKEDSQVKKIGGQNKNNNADDCMDNAGRTYVHEAFLADWRPNDSNGHSCLEFARNPHSGMLSQGAVQEQLHNRNCGKGPQPQTGNVQHFPSMFKYQHPSFHFDAVRSPGASTCQPNSSVSNTTLNTSKPLLYLRPYRGRRSYGTNLVKLAPGLPPVNLPPSVRVVSQSSFKGSPHDASTSASAAGGSGGDAEKESLMSQVPHNGKLGFPHVTKARENRGCTLNDDLPSSCAEESELVKDKCVEDESTTDSDLQMHPLLFQAPDGRLPYYPLNCNTSNSTSFSFFSVNQPQLNLSLLHNPQQENQVGCFTRSLQSKESTSLSQGIDFHPLLQRTDYVQLQYPFESNQTESLADTEPLATGKPVEKSNELDLEIHLSSMSGKERSWGRDVTAHKQVKSITPETQTSNRPLYQHAENPPSNSSEPVSCVHSPVLPSDEVDRYLDDMGDQSHPGIVMEQEELSDSDEENEENVEFECEEMTDSEGDEGSGGEQRTEMQIVERPNLATESVDTVDCDGKACESRTKSHSQGDPPNPGKNTPFLELGLMSQRKDDSSNSSWLSLDSSGSLHCPANVTENNQKDSTILESLATKSLASSRPSRSCKKKKLSMDEALDIELNSCPPRIPILRKSRKRARGIDANMNIELNAQNTEGNGRDRVS